MVDQKKEKSAAYNDVVAHNGHLMAHNGHLKSQKWCIKRKKSLHIMM